jgi:cyclopropane fatty-acyl-phospholipid synthase-like methyltransferase
MSEASQLDYGNWVSKKFIYIPGILTIIFLGLSFLSLFFLIGLVVFLIPVIYFTYAYFQFSPKGANLQTKIRDLALDQLSWNGKGKLLDIGCGNGALAIEAAKKYPEAQVTGIDYWGGQWEYSKSSCEKNAQIAGVTERTTFQKASAAKLPFPAESFDVTLSNFVFHEVQDAKDKREVVKEALRVLKKDGLFVFQDLFLLKRLYGEPQDLLTTIKSWGINDIKFVNTSDLKFIPGPMKLPFMVGQIAIIYGKK